MNRDIKILLNCALVLYYNAIAKLDSKITKDSVESHLKRIQPMTDEYNDNGTAIEDMTAVVKAMLKDPEIIESVGEYRFNILEALAISPEREHAKEMLLVDPTHDECRAKKKEVVSSLRSGLLKEQVESKVKYMAKMVMSGVPDKDSSIEIPSILSELTDLTREMRGKTLQRNPTTSLNDIDSVCGLLTEARESITEEGCYKTGLKGLDKALGWGIPRGYFINFDALSRNYKSGILTDLVVNIAHCNVPKMTDPKKKPLIIKVSFENDVKMDITIQSKKIREFQRQEKLTLDNQGTTHDRANAEMLYEYTNRNGYEVKIVHFPSTTFTASNFTSLLDMLEDEGYEIHVVAIDYLEKVHAQFMDDRAKGGTPEALIQASYDYVRNEQLQRNFTTINAHQIAGALMEEAGDNPAGFAKYACKRGLHQNCKSVYQKVDISVTLHVVPGEATDGNKYLSFSVGKNRTPIDIPEKSKHFFYMFEEFGGIVPDNDEDISKAIYRLPTSLSNHDGDGSGY